MDRRESLKLIAWSTISTSLIVEACKTKDEPEVKKGEEQTPATTLDRMKEEKEADEKIASGQFFNPHEMATIAVLADIIIPKDEVSGSATDAKVPGFIEFMVKDKPELQTPMRGGLRWLDMQMVKQYQNAFKDCSAQQQIAMVDAIAYPQKAAPEMKQGVNFFNLMRNLTASGFYTSEMGIKDVGYAGNKPNQWNGVPDDVLKQYKLAYTEKELKECISFNA
ncbi:MAG TPA: gluconate 2-dehydrogenase subunit 3 family protein [Flavisolibacter sp.]|nr:gluconate 2-dehydrogenase subunit 3 family protein [Flavisolibacter sp.]